MYLQAPHASINTAGYVWHHGGPLYFKETIIIFAIVDTIVITFLNIRNVWAFYIVRLSFEMRLLTGNVWAASTLRLSFKMLLLMGSQMNSSQRKFIHSRSQCHNQTNRYRIRSLDNVTSNDISRPCCLDLLVGCEVFDRVVLGFSCLLVVTCLAVHALSKLFVRHRLLLPIRRSRFNDPHNIRFGTHRPFLNMSSLQRRLAGIA